MINKFLIEFTDQRSHEMDKKYNRALGVPLFLISCILIPLIVFILTRGLEDQSIIFAATFVISASIAILTFLAVSGNAKNVFDEMMTYSIVKETSERKVIFNRKSIMTKKCYMSTCSSTAIKTTFRLKMSRIVGAY